MKTHIIYNFKKIGTQHLISQREHLQWVFFQIVDKRHTNESIRMPFVHFLRLIS
jgi:hypothetical protein